MLAEDYYAKAYAEALEAVAEHIRSFPEAYFGASNMCQEDGFDLQVHLERAGDGVTPIVKLRRNTVILAEDQICKFNW